MSLPPDVWEALLATLMLRGGYNAAVVAIGTCLLGVAAGVVGTFAFLRRRALLADALSHATLPGIVIAFLVGVAIGLETRSLALLLAGAALSGALGVICVHLIARGTRVPEDAAIGIVLSVFYGIGVVLLSYVQTLAVGGQAGLKTFILGQTAAMSRGEAMAIGILALGAIAATLLLFKEFRLVCFDPAFAESLGWPVGRVDLAMAALAVFVTVIGLQTVGLVLIVALLILPPVAARFWSESLPRIIALSAAFGGLAGYLGAALSAVLPNMPAGAVIVLVAGVFFLASLLLAPRRGVLAALARLALQRLRLHEVQVLRQLGEGRPVRINPGLRLWLRARRRVDAEGALTPSGRAAASVAARNLALWEAWLGEGADTLPRGTMWGVDPIEAALPADAVARLAARASA